MRRMAPAAFRAALRPSRLFGRASRLPSAREDFVEQRAEQATTYVVTIRWRDDVAKDMRFVYRGRKLRIQSVVDPDERRRFLICACEEIS